VTSSRRTHDDTDSAPEMTSRRETEEDDRESRSGRQVAAEDRSATVPAAGVGPADWHAHKNDVVTDRVIRQLIDQITQLQRVSDARMQLTSLMAAFNQQIIFETVFSLK